MLLANEFMTFFYDIPLCYMGFISTRNNNQIWIEIRRKRHETSLIMNDRSRKYFVVIGSTSKSYNTKNCKGQMLSDTY